jgi:hypothetical protein
MSEMGDMADGWLPLPEAPTGPAPEGNSLVLDEFGDPSVNLDEGVIRLPGEEHPAVLPKPVQVEEEETAADDEGDGED